MSRKSFWLALAALVIVRVVLMAVIPVFEPSEARYAAISANMARSGDFVVPHFTHNLEYQSFDGKPPLVFQAGGLCVKALGSDSPWALQLAVRLFPFASAAILLVILFSSVRRVADAETARLAVVICATCTAFLAAAGISMTDMTLTCAVAGALLVYRGFLDGYSTRDAVDIAALLGVGMMTKGPVALALFGLPVLLDAIVNRRWKGLFNAKWLLVAPVFLLIAVPWFVLVEQRNPGSVRYFFYNENFLRFITPDYGDKYGAGREAFRGVSVLWALVATLPWALLPIWAGVKGALARRRPSFAYGRDFLFLALVAIVGFWCLTSRVLLYYLFPVIPLFAAVLAERGPRAFLARLVPAGVGISLVVLVGGLVGGALFSDKMLGEKTPFVPWCNHYAYEFYHGRKSDAELAQLRAQMQQYRLKAALRQTKEGSK